MANEVQAQTGTLWYQPPPPKKNTAHNLSEKYFGRRFIPHIIQIKKSLVAVLDTNLFLTLCKWQNLVSYRRVNKVNAYTFFKQQL